jgi:hypothetical protein
MSYILKNTSGLINTRLTDTGRLKLSQGNFNIAYFQVGDSEVSYDGLPNTYNQSNTMVLKPAFNAQNSVGSPQSNKQHVKYPYFVKGVKGDTYGIPYMESTVEPIFNSAAPRGFFTGNSSSWSAYTSSQYVINSNYVVVMSGLTGGTTIKLIYSGCNYDIVRLPQAGDLITIYLDGNGNNDCYQQSTPASPTPTPTPTITPTYDACRPPDPTPTPSSTCCVPTPTGCTPTPTANTYMSIQSCYTMLTYRIVSVCLDEITLDRATPDFSYLGSCYYARTLVYPPTMTSLYDSVTPSEHWSTDVINFESVCTTDEFDVKVWNMNIPWSENPAGLDDTLYNDFSKFGSITYMGSKEYFGYMSSSGQTDTDSVYFYNSFDEQVIVTPEEQKAIAIIHYTNQSIDLFYGEKFAFETYDETNPGETGQARNFKLSIPWLMWHKSPTCCSGQTFYVDPPGFDEYNLFQVEYIKSKKNLDMNLPGLRYYNLWDTNPNDNGLPNRIGKVFPDQEVIIIDDEEIIAAMSYKSNRNWTLPAPKTSLTTPNTCGSAEQSTNGILSGNGECLFVTYRLSNSQTYTNSLHCNYYIKQSGPNLSCDNTSSQNVAVRFGPEFNCLNTTASTVNQGFVADTFEIICQKISCSGRPDSAEWKIIDMTSYLSASTVNGFLTQSGLTGTTFVITQEEYDSAPTYDLGNYIDLTTLNQTGNTLNFGDEYYFYGSIETDIQATIYEMRYKVNLGKADFQTSTNPSWTQGNTSYITEIGLYDDQKDLMIISKLQSPVVRQGIQQFLIKFDF